MQRSRRIRLFAGVLGCVLGSVAVAHAGLELLSRRAEERGVYLWHREEYLLPLSPKSFEGLASGGLLLCGPSNAREALRGEVFEAELPGVRAVQAALSWGTIADCTLMLEYLEQAYGPDAVPEYLVIGVTVRWLCNAGLEMSPFVRAVDKYSPTLRVESPLDAPRLVPKSWLDGLDSRARFALHQSRRYKGALLALVDESWPGLFDPAHVAERLEPYRFARRRPRPESSLTRFRGEPTGLWGRVQRWDASKDATRVRGDFERLLSVVERRGGRAFVVNLPMRTLARDFYDDERYQAYLEVLRDSIGDTPFLDLGALLDDSEFFDSVHVTRRGGERTSRAISELVHETSADFADRQASLSDDESGDAPGDEGEHDPVTAG